MVVEMKNRNKMLSIFLIWLLSISTINIFVIPVLGNPSTSIVFAILHRLGSHRQYTTAG